MLKYIVQMKVILLTSLIYLKAILKKGEKTLIPGPRKRESRSLTGSLCLRTGKFFWKSSKSGDAKIFIQHLHQLRQHSKGKTTIVIVDNASIHRSKKVKKFLELHKDVKLYFLPPYSPEYNPVEIVWRILKKIVLGARHISGGIDEVLQRIRKVTRKWALGIEKLNVGSGTWSKIFE